MDALAAGLSMLEQPPSPALPVTLAHPDHALAERFRDGDRAAFDLPALERKIQNQLRKAIVQRHAAGSAGNVDVDDDQEPDELGPQPPPKQLRRREAPLAPRGTPSTAPGNTPPCNPNAEPCR